MPVADDMIKIQKKSDPLIRPVKPPSKQRRTIEEERPDQADRSLPSPFIIFPALSQVILPDNGS